MSTTNTTKGDLGPQKFHPYSRYRQIHNFGHQPGSLSALVDLDRNCPSCTDLRDYLSEEGLPTNNGRVLMHQKGYLTESFQFRSDHDSFCDLVSLRVINREFLLDERNKPYVEYPEYSSYPDDTILPGLIDSRRVDFDLMKNWMDHCLSTHNCGPGLNSTSTIPNQHVIDCYTRKVIPAPRGCDYAALSYVWGQSQTSSRHGETLGTVPRTIEDAIRVTQTMETRYLWVDRYCILQDDAQHKMEQIHSMHKIYSNAKFTIVAAAGEDPDHGLPGVSDQHRCEQPRMRFGYRLMVSTLSHPSNLICSSKWWERGWTYQECMHSRRLLFFTKEQVYFQCNETAFCESLHVPASVGLPRNPNFGFVEGLDVWSSINQYLRRELTHPSDILNAVISVLQSFQERQRMDFRHLWGLPIRRDSKSQTWSELFSAALLWTFKRPATRREGFPSWSWTGWYGKDLIPYEHRQPLRTLCDVDDSSGKEIHRELPEFMLNASNGRLISVEDLLIPSHDDETPSSVLQVKAHVVRLRFARRKFNSEVRIYGLNYKGNLRFLTKVFTIDFSQQSLGCSFDKAVQGSEANYLGIIVGSDRLEENVLLLIVEEKGTLFERIGVCSARHKVVFGRTVLCDGTSSRLETQVRTISLG